MERWGTSVQIPCRDDNGVCFLWALFPGGRKAKAAPESFAFTVSLYKTETDGTKGGLFQCVEELPHHSGTDSLPVKAAVQQKPSDKCSLIVGISGNEIQHCTETVFPEVSQKVLVLRCFSGRQSNKITANGFCVGRFMQMKKVCGIRDTEGVNGGNVAIVQRAYGIVRGKRLGMEPHGTFFFLTKQAEDRPAVLCFIKMMGSVCYFAALAFFWLLITFSRENSSRSFSSRASVMNFTVSSKRGIIIFLSAFARFCVFLIASARR